MKPTITVLALTATLALGACGDSNDNSGAATAATNSTDTVSMASIEGASVVVDAKGNALYSADQEKGGMIRCTGGCTSVWLPLTTSGKPTASSDVSGTVGVVKRPDGSRQVTLDRRPLYRFAEDRGPGKVTGDGISDSFGGRQFTWHVEGSSAGSGTGGGGTYSY